MGPTPEGTAWAKKEWNTIRKKAAETIAKDKEASEILETAEAKEATLSLERDLQAALRSDIEQLENGLAISDGGKEKIGPSGRIDILAIDARKQIVVIELKVGTAEHEVISQILSYMGTSKRKLEGL